MSEPDGGEQPVEDVHRASLGARLRVARSRRFVGRVSELDLFRTAVEDELPPFAVLYVHGPGGVGKTALLHRFAEEAETAGHRPVLLDCRFVEPTPQAFLEAVAAALGSQGPEAGIAALRSSHRPVLLLDSYEAIAPLDGWTRQTLLPQLPAGAVVVIASRQPPAGEWRADPGWRDLLRITSLRNLPPDDARELLAVHGAPPERYDEALGFAGGHPLALTLVADLLAGHADASLSAHDSPQIVEVLLDRFVEHVPSDAHREALAVCAHARVTTEALLRDAVPDAPARDLFDWLRSLTFVEQAPDGLTTNDLVQEVLDADLRWRDPPRYAAMHRRVRGHLLGRVQEASPDRQEPATLDLLYLNRFHPLASGYFAWRTTGDVWMEPMTPADQPALLALASRHEGEHTCDLVRYWVERQPDAFRVFRAAGSAEPAGFLAHLMLWDSAGDEEPHDPVVTSVLDHTRRAGPIRAGEGISILRFWVGRDQHQDVTTHHLVCTRTALDWIMTPRLGWSFAVVAEPDLWEPLLDFVDFPRVPEADVEVDGRRCAVFAHDWRAVPLTSWGEAITERQLAADAGPASIGATHVALEVLSQPEFQAAVRDALRNLSRARPLDGNPLLRSRVVVELAGDRPAGQVLQELLVEAVQQLAGHPRNEKLYRALMTTYVKPAPTQEAAAERLGLPFSTYRRHLASGLERVAALLWERELYGAPPDRQPEAELSLS